MFLRAAPAQAHAFGPRYDLPLPLELYVAGAGGAVALSFVIMALVFRTRPARTDPLRIDLLRFGPLRLLLHPALIGVLRTTSVGLFLLVLATGFFGNQDTLENFAPTFVWIIWWVGLAYVVALIGDLWPVIDPWSSLHAGLERLARRFGLRAPLDLGLAYPAWLGVWPAVVLFGLFAWLELICQAAKIPATLATIVLIYSGLTWLGMVAFGRRVWLAHGEAFALAFGTLGRFAPIAAPERSAPDAPPGHWYTRSYASGLVVDRPCQPAMTVFVLLLLATVTFDGLKETPLWAGLLQWIGLEPWLHPSLVALHKLGFDLLVVIETATLALFPLLFLLVYLGFCWLAREASDSERSVTEIAGLFVFSLVPIAIAYHLAHYLSYLLVAGQLIIPLASDPFGIGWNLFGSAGYRIDISIIGARFVWYTAVVAIVVGHVFAVGVAHFVALRAFETARAALASQYPFLVLMVAYTMVSLWILSQPIVESPNLRSFGAPAGTLSLAPFAFHEACFEMAALEELRYGFESDRPVQFDIHYHEGFTIRHAVQLSEVSTGADEFVAELDQLYCLRWTNDGLTRASLSYRILTP